MKKSVVSACLFLLCASISVQAQQHKPKGQHAKHDSTTHRDYKHDSTQINRSHMHGAKPVGDSTQHKGHGGHKEWDKKKGQDSKK